MVRTAAYGAHRYVSVTSAMQLVKTLLGEQPDYYGPLARLHAAEGEGCHRVCLEWLASTQSDMPITDWPTKPDDHPDVNRWEVVLSEALARFKDFVRQYKIEPIGIEQEDFSRAYGLVGHIDLPAYFTIPGRKRMKGPIDLKFTGSILESHKLQVRCYGRLDGMRGSNLGGIFWCPRDKDGWKFEPVSLTANLADVAAVSHAARLWEWGEQKKGA